MAEIGIFDIVGPIMVGPSSSHTAGAVRLGLAARRILGDTPVKANIALHGSFAATYWGHRTDVAILAGILGMSMDNPNIPYAKGIADQQGLEYQFVAEDLGDVHPNTVRIKLYSNQTNVSMVGSSVGGGRIHLSKIDGFELSCDGTYSVLITEHRDEPGIISEITRVLGLCKINIAFLEVSRKSRGSKAMLVAQTDDPIDHIILEQVSAVPGVDTVRRLPSF